MSDGKKGSVPAAYIAPVAAAGGADATATPTAGAPTAAASEGSNVQADGGRARYTVLANFEGDEPWQMKVAAGDVVEMVSDHGDGWADVARGGETGGVPVGYLEAI